MTHDVSTGRRLGLAAGTVACLMVVLMPLFLLPSDLGRLEFLPWAGFVAAPFVAATCMRFFVPPEVRERWSSSIALCGGTSLAVVWLLAQMPAVHDGGAWVVGLMMALLLGGPFVGAWLATAKRS